MKPKELMMEILKDGYLKVNPDELNEHFEQLKQETAKEIFDDLQKLKAKYLKVAEEATKRKK